MQKHFRPDKSKAKFSFADGIARGSGRACAHLNVITDDMLISSKPLSAAAGANLA